MVQLLTRPALRLGDILRRHGAAYAARHSVSPEQSQVLRRLADCRTAALGGHLETCSGCGYARASYNSCRDRHCPTCQASKRAAWLKSRLERLLPAPYFHVVFTVPDLLYPLMLHNQRRLYHLLFQAASAALLRLSADRRRLGAQVGITALLHTWGQKLLFHPHLHCVVTGGGLSMDGQRWVAAKRRFFLPVKVLGRLFRGKFLAGLREAYEAGLLTLGGSTAELADPATFRRWLGACYGRDWVVYAKPPFGGPERVFRYLGRYSHRVAIANSRLLSADDTHVTFAWKDYADEQRSKVMRLTIDEFIRRFLLHVLPKGFVRIRHYGLLAGVNVATKLERCRHLLGETDKPEEARPTRTWVEWVLEWTGQDPRHCPRCQGPLERREVPPIKGAALPREELPRPHAAATPDSS
jgi:hypothetical protein